MQILDLFDAVVVFHYYEIFKFIQIVPRVESQYKIFEKTWSPHFVPFSHGERGQNVATKFCQKNLYCDSTLVRKSSNHY